MTFLTHGHGESKTLNEFECLLCEEFCCCIKVIKKIDPNNKKEGWMRVSILNTKRSIKLDTVLPSKMFWLKLANFAGILARSGNASIDSCSTHELRATILRFVILKELIQCSNCSMVQLVPALLRGRAAAWVCTRQPSWNSWSSLLVVGNQVSLVLKSGKVCCN